MKYSGIEIDMAAHLLDYLKVLVEADIKPSVFPLEWYIHLSVKE